MPIYTQLRDRNQETYQSWIRTSVFAENYPRAFLTNTDITIGISGTLYLLAGPKLYAGEAVSNFSVLVNTASNGLTHSWFCLVDTALNVLCKTADDTNAWSTGERTVAMGSPFTITADITPYVGILVTSTVTQPGLRGISAWATAKTLTPRLTAFSTTGLTTPASLGATAAALTTDFGSGLPWVGIS